ncbi:uncharacterized protein, partial [Penaeus vannamei]|uniref:uncharacterized protein n=1 Tax=Penaeus vannamei TaxID=6689 RepID=UPI00387FA303
VTAVRSISGQIVSDPVAVRERWAEYFEQLYQVDPPIVNLDVISVEILLLDPPISEDPPSLTEVMGAISKLRSGKAAGICGIPAELLKAGGEPMARGLHTVLAAIRWSVAVPPDLLRVIVERRHEFRRRLLVACIELKKVFDMTKVQDFGDLLGEPVQSVRACGEDIEVTESFTYLGSLVHNSGLSDHE